MERKLFGTDGVRGKANAYPMTADLVQKLGAAAGRFFRRDGSPAHRVVIGKDTRLSGYMFENALTAGLRDDQFTVSDWYDLDCNRAPYFCGECDISVESYLFGQNNVVDLRDATAPLPPING